MRAFIAVDIPKDISSAIAKAVSDCGLSVKPIPLENMHITLEFLGNIGSLEVTRVISVLDAVRSKPFLVSLEHAHTFGTRGNIAVIDVVDGRDELIALQGLLRAGLSWIKDLDNRAYVPHLSIARGNAKDLETLADSINTNGIIDNTKANGFYVTSIMLKDSVLKAPHAEYRTIFEKRLAL